MAGIVLPRKVRRVEPAAKVVGTAPQVPPTAPPAVMFTSVSVKAPPLRAEPLLLDRVKVTVEVPAG